METKIEMKNSYLIQRLQKPYENKEGLLQKASEVFAFGGGFRNGGLTNEAMELIRPIFRFDYMGSAEYEFGAVPQALSNIVKNIENYIAFEKEINFQYKNYFSPRKKGYEPEIVKGKVTVYFICHKDWKEEVIEIVKAHATEKHSEKTRTKEAVLLASNIGNTEHYEKYPYSRSVGWLELNNGYFFFIDKEMFEKTKTLFGIKNENN